MRMFVFLAILLSLPVTAMAQNSQVDASMLQDFGNAVTAGDRATASAMLENDALILSYFNERFWPENLDVLIANYEGLEQLDNGSAKDTLLYNMCNGTAGYLLQVKSRNGKIYEVHYGSTTFSPPPIPMSKKNDWDQCKPPVRFVGDLK